MIYLDRHGNGDPVKVDAIAEAVDIPKTYLSKLMQLLVHERLVKSFKGRNGGIMLSRTGKSIMLCEIIQAVDGTASALDGECMLGLAACNSQHPCPLHFRWSIIRETIEKRILYQPLSNLGQMFSHQ